MRLGKLVLFVFCLVLVVGIANAKQKHGSDTLYVIPKTAVAPVIDGKIDPIWNTVDYEYMPYFNYANGAPADWSMFSGWTKLMWDDNKIYGLFYMMDDVVDSVSTIDWQMDGVEFYADPDNIKIVTTSLPASKTHLTMRPAQTIAVGLAANRGGLEYAWLVDTASIHHAGPSGYYVEFSILLDSLGIEAVAGTKFGTELQADDNDNNGAGRIGICKWWNNSGSDDDWQGTQHWGSAVLSGVVVDTVVNKYTFVKIPNGSAPTIDANLDAIWDNANQLTEASRGNGTYYPATMQDIGYRFYGLYDDNNLYGFFRIMDDIIDSTTTIDWQMDDAEIYVDAQNRHEAGSSRPADAYQFCFRPAQTYAVGLAANGHGVQYAWKVIPKGNDTVLTAGSGYTVELSVPLDSLGLANTVGTQFSMQLQDCDNDLTTDNRLHIQKWWNFVDDNDWQQTLRWGDAVLGPLAGSVGVAAQSGQIARSFELAQNYPNPFNPSTEISFTLAKSGKVRLTVYNLLGKEVAVLVNGMRNAGSQTVTFDAKNLSSGVYFYKLEAGSTMIAKKMMLLK
jgi:hypothetical protein